MPLRRRLFGLTAAGILPLAVMAGISLYALQEQQRAQTERVGLELARSVANAVDAELRSTISILETLATTPTLDRNDLSGFHERAARINDLRPDWAGILLTDASGTPLADTRSLPGHAFPALLERETFDLVLQTRAPVVGHLARHAIEEWLFTVRVPVLRGGSVDYVITALIRPEAILDVLTRQQVPADWVISIIDAKGLRVARSRAHEQNLGGRLSESAQQVVAVGGPEGFGVSYALEGDRIFTPYSRLPSTGWVAVLGIPTSLVDAAAYRSLAIYGGGILLSIVLGTLGALWVARTIMRPIAALGAAAEAVGNRQTPQPPETSLPEIRAVAAALSTAAKEITKGEIERENLLRKERQARAAAEAADRAKDEFMAVLSHELRTPLNAVYGWARMLQNGQLRDTATTARAIDVIVRNADVQVQLIDDLLDLSRISSGKMSIEVRPVEIESVLRSAVDAVRPAADAKSIRLQTAFEGRSSILADPARLQQIVWNLLSNAVKFTPNGGNVRIELQREDSQFNIVVSDTGQGIAPEMLPYVFHRFRQADSSSTRSHGGLGLGLALVKHLVELHGGRVVAHSDGDGHGATFTVTLPAVVTSKAAGSVHKALRSSITLDAPISVVGLDGLRVLVVDDDHEGLALTDAILTRAGADVRATASAAAAFELLQLWRPHVLVSDIEMPGEDGYSLIRKIRALGDAQGGSTPAIALSAYGRTQDRVQSLTAGFNMHVPKPVDPGELTTIVAGVAGVPEQPRTS